MRIILIVELFYYSTLLLLGKAVSTQSRVRGRMSPNRPIGPGRLPRTPPGAPRHPRTGGGAKSTAGERLAASTARPKAYAS